MAFMRASISNKPETWLITEYGDSEIITCLPDGDYFDLDEADFRQIADDNNLDIEDVREEYSAALKESINLPFTIVTGYRGWLSAPGYLDRTSVIVHDSVAEVARHLLNMYYDQPLEDMDDDELEDSLWLSDLCESDRFSLTNVNAHVFSYTWPYPAKSMQRIDAKRSILTLSFTPAVYRAGNSILKRVKDRCSWLSSMLDDTPAT